MLCALDGAGTSIKAYMLFTHMSRWNNYVHLDVYMPYTKITARLKGYENNDIPERHFHGNVQLYVIVKLHAKINLLIYSIKRTATACTIEEKMR